MSDQWGNAPQEPQPAETLPQYPGGFGYPGGEGPGDYPQLSGPPRTGKLAITSLILGVVSLPAMFLGIGPLLALVGLILGIVGILGARRKNLKRGIGTAGIIVSAVSLIAGVLLLVAASNATHACRSVDHNNKTAYEDCLKHNVRL
jgi:hypothetical protein